MRGEETELMGIIKSEYGKCVYILPGSHSKIIYVDDKGRIIDFVTMMTGEMIMALSHNTILNDAVALEETELNSEYLLKGYDYCRREGINKSLFKVRILKSVFNSGEAEIYSFFIGVILFAEIQQIIDKDIQTIVIGGKAQIRKAMAEILKNVNDKKVIVLNEEEVKLSTVLGAIEIFEGEKKN